MAEIKVPKRVLIFVERLRKGECLAQENTPKGGKRQFWWEPSGKLAAQRSVEKAISLGLIVPAGDGLFGDSQTYRAA